MFAIQFFLNILAALVSIEWEIIKPVIKQILSKNTRHQHKSSLLFLQMLHYLVSWNRVGISVALFVSLPLF